jgi:hypothetical protein
MMSRTTFVTRRYGPILAAAVIAWTPTTERFVLSNSAHLSARAGTYQASLDSTRVDASQPVGLNPLFGAHSMLL